MQVSGDVCFVGVHQSSKTLVLASGDPQIVLNDVCRVNSKAYKLLHSRKAQIFISYCATVSAL